MVGAATACNRDVGFKPVPISFATHPSVLRGAWSGVTTADQTLKLQLIATYDTPRQYQVSGTGSLDTEVLTVAGTAVGGSIHSYLKAQTSPIPEFTTLTLKRPGMADLKLRCFPFGGNLAPSSWAWQCFLPGETTSFKLAKGTP